jgi:hypothetical protein
MSREASPTMHYFRRNRKYSDKNEEVVNHSPSKPKIIDGREDEMHSGISNGSEGNESNIT